MERIVAAMATAMAGLTFPIFSNISSCFPDAAATGAVVGKEPSSNRSRATKFSRSIYLVLWNRFADANGRVGCLRAVLLGLQLSSGLVEGS